MARGYKFGMPCNIFAQLPLLNLPLTNHVTLREQLTAPKLRCALFRTLRLPQNELIRKSLGVSMTAVNFRAQHLSQTYNY